MLEKRKIEQRERKIKKIINPHNSMQRYTDNQQPLTENISLFNNNKKHFRKLEQLLKADEDLPEYEKDEEQEISYGLLTHEKQTHLPPTGSNYESYKLSIQKQDIGNLELTQLLKQADMNKLTHVELDLTNQMGQESTCVLLSILLSKLANLENLDLIIQQNEIKDFQAEQLSLGFQTMKQLRSLKFNMYQCNFSDQGITFLAQGLSQLAFTLTTLALNLNKNLFDVNGFISVSVMLGKFTKLQELELTIGNNFLFENKMTNALGIEALTKSISKMVLLKKLEFSFFRCKISLVQTSCIFQCIQPLVNLKHLTIFMETSNIAKKQVVALTKKFKYFKELQTIKFELMANGLLLFGRMQNQGEKEGEAEGGKYNGDWMTAIELSCKKNARSLVNYQMLIQDPFEL